MAVKVCQFMTDRIEIQEPVDLAQQVVTGNVTLDLETVNEFSCAPDCPLIA